MVIAKDRYDQDKSQGEPKQFIWYLIEQILKSKEKEDQRFTMWDIIEICSYLNEEVMLDINDILKVHFVEHSL